MYSDVSHIIDFFNEIDNLEVSISPTGDKGVKRITLSGTIARSIAPDSTGTLYIHLTDGVQHKRIQVVKKPTPLYKEEETNKDAKSYEEVGLPGSDPLTITDEFHFNDSDFRYGIDEQPTSILPTVNG